MKKALKRVGGVLIQLSHLRQTPPDAPGNPLAHDEANENNNQSDNNLVQINRAIAALKKLELPQGDHDLPNFVKKVLS